MKSIDENAVLAALKEHGRGLHWMELCVRLEYPKSEKHRLLDALESLREAGQVTELPGRRFRIRKKPTPKPAPRIEGTPPRRGRGGRKGGYRRDGNGPSSTTSGVLSMTTKGFGFVTAVDGEGDVFVPPGASGAALHGDRVELRVQRSPKGREGEVIEVISRRNPEITGTLEKVEGKLVVTPDDIRIRGPIFVVGKKPDKKMVGLSVKAKLRSFPQSYDDFCTAEVFDVLGVQGMTTVEVMKTKIREGIIEEHTPEAIAQAEAYGTEVPERDKETRRDIRGLDLVTIDPDDARDHDDAIFCQRTDDGFHVVIGIADVAHYVTPLSALDETALERGCSIYLPDRAIPMLPRALSSHLASLVPHEDRLCMGIEVFLDTQGKVRDYSLFEGVMRSGGRLTYKGVARALGMTDEGPHQESAVARLDALNALLDLSRMRREMRVKRGSLDFELPEPRVRLDSYGVEPVDVVRSKADLGVRDAYRMVEEMMLLANELVAKELKQKQVPGIYRAHGKPDEKKIDTFCKVAAALGFFIDPDEARDPRTLSGFLKTIEEHPDGHILRSLLLRSMQQAAYSTSGDIGHFGLGTQDYLHFTSPIRRYPDLVVHRIVKLLLREEPIDRATLMPRMRQAAVEASRLERRAMTVEREVVQLYRTILMRDRVGETFEGTIVSVETYGMRVSLDEPFVDLFIPTDRMDDYFTLDELGIRLMGGRTGARYELGARLEVELYEANIPTRELIGIPVGEPVKVPGAPAKGRPKKPRKGGKNFKRARPTSKKKGGGSFGRGSKSGGRGGKSGGRGGKSGGGKSGGGKNRRR